MKKTFITLICIFSISILFSQTSTSIVYKRNILTGELDVYESDGITGLPKGNPIATIKRNRYGYIEMTNLQRQDIKTSIDSYTSMPNYDAFHVPQSDIYFRQVIDQITAFNKAYQLEYSYKNKLSENKSNEMVKALIEERDIIAKNYLDFYSSVSSFPERLKDGWYDAVQIITGTGHHNSSLYIARVENSKIVELYANLDVSENKDGYVFQKIELEVASSITKCKAVYRDKGSMKYNNLFFLDNIIDVNKQIENPSFGYYTIYTSNLNLSEQNLLYVGVFKNAAKKIDSDFIDYSPYVTVLSKDNILQNNFSCNNSLMTLAFKNSSDKFSVGILNLSTNSLWAIDNFNILPNECKSTIIQSK